MIEHTLRPVQKQKFSAVILACTHYPLLERGIKGIYRSLLRGRGSGLQLRYIYQKLSFIP
jgi:glutamate racemase